MFPFHLCNHPGKLNIGCQHQSLAVSVWTAAFRRESFPLHEYHEFHLHLLRRVEPFLGVHCSAAYSLFLSFFLSFFLSLSLNFVLFVSIHEICRLIHVSCCCAVGWTPRWMDGWTDGWMDGWRG